MEIQSKIEVRKLTEADLESFFRCRLRALQQTPTAFLISYQDELAQGPGRFLKSLGHRGSDRAIFGAVKAGVVIATLAVFKEEQTRINHKAMIWGVHVDQEYRGQGLGGKMIDQAIAFAKNEMKVMNIGLSVETLNESARKLYESRGFVR